MRTWRESIEDAAKRHDGYRNMLRGGASEGRAIGYAVRCMADDAAKELHRELFEPGPYPPQRDPSHWLALLTAYLTFDTVLVLGMTADEFFTVFESSKPHSPATRLNLVRDGIRHGLITEAQGKELLTRSSE